MTDALTRLIAGFRTFHDRYFQQNRALYERLTIEGQVPKVLVVGCSDARVDPAILTYAQPGDLFVVRNVGAIVPPHEEAGRGERRGAKTGTPEGPSARRPPPGMAGTGRIKRREKR